jgi:hypothetical protein
MGLSRFEFEEQRTKIITIVMGEQLVKLLDTGLMALCEESPMQCDIKTSIANIPSPNCTIKIQKCYRCQAVSTCSNGPIHYLQHFGE